MESKQKITIINVILIIMLVICLVLCAGLIIISTSKSSIEIAEKSVEELQKNYASTEETSSANTWNISATENDNVIASLLYDGKLIISGTGHMKDWGGAVLEDWHEMRDKVKTIIIENGVTNIGDGAFYGCKGLTNIEIPSSVTSIGDKVFYRCESLKNIKIEENNTVYKDENGILYTKDGTRIIKYPEGKDEKQYTILKGVTNIGEYAFYGCKSLTNIEIPSSVTSIEDTAFAECESLTNIEIPNSVTNIGEYAFHVCVSLTNIEIPSSVTSIGEGTFRLCYSLTSIEIPESVISIGKYAFEGCADLSNVEIPEGVTSIGREAFSGCVNLKRIYLPKEIASIEYHAFKGKDYLTIICRKDSIAQSYAQENEIDYLIIMDGINPKTTVSQLIQNLESKETYEIKDKNGEVITKTTYVTTGSTVEMVNGEKYIVIVTGDCTGDGKADIQDIFAINKHRLNNGKLINEYLLAGDANRDGKTNINDIFEINKYRLGIKEIL